jgi:hypothetical protein
MLISRDDLNRLISRAAYYMLGGVAMFGVVQLFDFGGFTAFNLFGFGVLLACFTDYRTERGLWMLALLYGGLFLLFALAAEYFHIADLLRGAQPPAGQVAVDFAIGLYFQWKMVRVAASVVVYNRELASSGS